MLEENLKITVCEARKQNISLETMIKRLTEEYEEAEERDKINKKNASEIAKRVENLFFKIYDKEQIKLYIEVVEILHNCTYENGQICAICESIDYKYNYKKGYTYGRINSMTQYLLFRVLDFSRIQQRELKKKLKSVYGGSTPYIKCLVFYEFDISKIKESV